MKIRCAIADLLCSRPQSPIFQYLANDQSRALDWFLAFPKDFREPLPFVSMSLEEPETVLEFSREVYLMRLTLRNVMICISDKCLSAVFVGKNIVST